ncbi:MAG: hypothetical protein ACJ75Q_00540 [Gaiellaceae bacterium]
MASSKIDHESGIVTITTPGRAAVVGDRFYVQGSAATYGIAHADWVLRLLGAAAALEGADEWHAEP